MDQCNCGWREAGTCRQHVLSISYQPFSSSSSPWLLIASPLLPAQFFAEGCLSEGEVVNTGNESYSDKETERGCSGGSDFVWKEYEPPVII